MAKKKSKSSGFPLTFLIMIIGIVTIAFLNPDNFFKPFVDMGKSLGILILVIIIAFVWDYLSHKK